MKSSLVDISCFLRLETSRAWLINDGCREVWIPKSQGELSETYSYPPDTYSQRILTIPEWLAKEKELI